MTRTPDGNRWRRGFRLAMLATLLAVAACGGGGSPSGPAPGTEDRIEVTFGDPGFNKIGLTTWGEPTVVTVLHKLIEPYLSWTLIHELLHAAGLVEHESDPACYLFAETAGWSPGLALCPSETARLAERVRGPYEVIVRQAVLEEPVLGAIEFLNAAAGYDVFVFRGVDP